MISQSIIDQVSQRTDIVQVAEAYGIELKRKGKEYAACCPFHGDRNPSFFVSPARQSFYCFGCGKGGSVFNFVMEQEKCSFPEAVEVLAKQAGVTIEQRVETPEEKEQAQLRESMRAAYPLVQQFYEQQLAADNLQASDARAYIAHRWPDDRFCKEYGFGYAPASSQPLLQFIKEHSLSQNVLLEMGVLAKNDNGQLYSAFRERIMIPIRDLQHRIIGYTARYIGQDEEVAKYKNSRNSILYNKSEAIFGIEAATRTATQLQKFYIVEGAPDVIRLQMLGIYNTVAPLGTALTAPQLAKLKRFAHSVCFLPDNDPPKGNDQFGAGFNAVIKNGIEATKAGFNVTVKMIPPGPAGEKNDADSYCKTPETFSALEEIDFTAWYLQLLLQGKQTNSEKHEAMGEVAKVLALINEDSKTELLIGGLSKIISNKVTWSKLVNEQKKSMMPTTKKEMGMDVDSLTEYGFEIRNNCYVSLDKNNQSVLWSNFILTPLFHIRDSSNPVRIYEMRNVYDQTVIIEFKQEDLGTLTRFKNKVEGYGNFLWFAKEEHLNRVKIKLYKETDTAVKIAQLGWQRQGFYAFGNGIVINGNWLPTDELGIVKLGDELGNFYLPACSKVYQEDPLLYVFERNFTHRNLNAISLYDYAKMLTDVFGDNAMMGIAYLFASLFHDVIVGQVKNFPILDIFGQKGSGKTQLAIALMAFFVNDTRPQNLQSSTKAAIADAVAQAANALVHLDEYKNNLDLGCIDFLKGLWDGAGRTRMNMDKDKKRESTRVDSGIIITGQEMPTVDIALYSRLIFLTNNRSEFTTAERQRFLEMDAVRKRGCSHLTIQLLKYRTQFEQGFHENFDQVGKELSRRFEDSGIEDRILFNWQVPLAAFRTLQDYISLPFSYSQLYDFAMQGIARQNSECKQNNEIATFWNIVVNLMQEGKIVEKGDYLIKVLSSLKCSDRNHEMAWDSPRKVIIINHRRLFYLYKEQAKQISEELLSESALEHYLKNSAAYLGKKNSQRFAYFIKGQPIKEETGVYANGNKQYKQKNIMAQALCFDYQKIVDEFGINLEVLPPAEEND